MNRWTIGIAAISLGAVAAATALAENVWVSANTVEVREGKGAVYPVIGEVRKGQQLNVVAREGKWLKVQLGDKQGYVFENAVSAQKVDAGNNPFAGIKADSAAMSSGLAGKGLEQKAETYASTKGMSTAPLNHLIAVRGAIQPQELESFQAQGNVGAK